jgi:hypothetical protein
MARRVEEDAELHLARVLQQLERSGGWKNWASLGLAARMDGNRVDIDVKVVRPMLIKAF